MFLTSSDKIHKMGELSVFVFKDSFEAHSKVWGQYNFFLLNKKKIMHKIDQKL